MSKRKSQPSDFRRILESISHRHDSRKVFDAFTRFAACALAYGTREAEYLEEAKRWEKRDMDSFAHAFGALVSEMETQPFEDVLGKYYMEFALSTKGQQWNGEFHTPKPICDLLCGAPHKRSFVALVVMWRPMQLARSTGMMSHTNAT